MQVPKAIAEWGPIIESFDENLVGSMISLLRHTEAAMGVTKASQNKNGSQPDGFDGVSRRGKYERLLTSEWLLATDEPLEFLRRATDGEHTFLKLAHVVPREAEHTVVIVDAGPSQLGTPRLVHLAALIILARRAEKANSLFTWCFAQKPDEHYTAVTSSTLLNMLDQRFTVDAEVTHVKTARVQFQEVADDHVWLIGGERMSSNKELAMHPTMVIDDVLEVGVQQVSVSVRSPRKPFKTLNLDLPSNSICGRLLRNPFVREKDSSTSKTHLGLVRPISNIIYLSRQGLAALGPDVSSLLCAKHQFAEQNQEHQTLQTFSKSGGCIIVAAKRMNRAIPAVWIEPSDSTLGAGCLRGKSVWFSGQYDCDFDIDIAAAREAKTLTQIWGLHNKDGRKQAYFLLHDGRLISLQRNPNQNKHTAVVVDSDVVHVEARRYNAHYVSKADSGSWRYTVLSDRSEPVTSAIVGEGGGIVLGNPPSSVDSGLVAYSTSDTRWEVRHSNDVSIFHNVEGIVHGVRLGSDRRPQLVVQTAHRQLVLKRAYGGIVHLPLASEDIADVTTDSERGLIATRTRWGSIAVYSIAAQKNVWEYRPSTTGGRG